MTYEQIAEFHGKDAPESVRDARAAFADWILSAPADKMLSLAPVEIDDPPPARIHQSVTCSSCGERAMETRIEKVDGKPLCIPCARGRAELSGGPT